MSFSLNNVLALSAPPVQRNLVQPTLVQVQPKRVPPPCWSDDETAALIDSYRQKWYSLNRGNLKGNHWQEVADSVSEKCPIPTAPKTSLQCRHKMEKLRKRYRNCIVRASNNRNVPNWVHFNLMHAMEQGSNINDVGAEEEEDEDDEEIYQSIRHGMPNHGYRINSGKIPSFGDSTRVVGNGFREKYSNFYPNPSFGGVTRVVGKGYREKRANFDREPSFVGVSRVSGNGYGKKVATFGPNPYRGVGSAEKLGKRKEREGEREAMGEMVGIPSKGSNIDDVGAEEEEDEDDEELYQSIRHGMPNHGYRINSGKIPSFGDSTRVVGHGFREKYSNFDPNPSFGGVTRVVGKGYMEKSANFDREPSFVGVSRVSGNGYREKVATFGPNPCRGVGSAEKLGKRKEREGEREAMGEMVAAVRALGDGYVRIEKMKMKMAREVETMRMEMELKRTKMILESEQRIVEAFASASSESHKEAKGRGASES